MPTNAKLILKNIVTGIKKENLLIHILSQFWRRLKMLLESLAYILKKIS